MANHRDLNRRSDGSVPIASYAVLGDGRTICLIATDGRVDWLPVPSLDAPPLFGALLDAPDGGSFELSPAGDAVADRRYVPGTNVLETIWRTDRGTAVVRDALVTGAAGRLPWTQLDRVIIGVDGDVEFGWRVAPGTLLGDAQPVVETHGTRKVVRIGDMRVAVAARIPGTDAPDEPIFCGSLVVSEGTTEVLSLTATAGEPLRLPDPDPGNVERTVRSWREWSDAHSYGGDHGEAATRSALALKLLIQSPTGSIAAAATTSLPENPSGEKNWDYRFAWVRDLAFTVRALTRFGLTEETHAMMRWLLDALEDQHGDMPIFFSLRGGVVKGVVNKDVPGWRGIGPVRIGNRASGQRQLGVYGSILTIAREYIDAGHVLDDRARVVLARIADDAARRWRGRDSGIWELPKQRHYVTSKLGCWQALDAAVRLADSGHLDGDHARWARERDKIATWVDRHGWSRRLGAYAMYPGSSSLDASVLLFVGVGFPGEQKLAASVDAIRQSLAAGPQLYRYSGMDKEEQPFVACGFWLVSALARLGHADEAEVLFTALADSGNDLGLFSEMIAPDGELWGNMVQALSHLALINAAIDLDDGRGSGRDDGS